MEGGAWRVGGRHLRIVEGRKGFDTAYSFGPYEDELRRMIQLYKYDRIHTLAAPLGRMLVAGLQDASVSIAAPADRPVTGETALVGALRVAGS